MILAAANVVGGFVVTDRMLEMFKKREPPKQEDDAVSQTRPTSLYLVTIICFILALRFLSSTGNGAARQPDRRRRHGVAIVGHLRAEQGRHVGWEIVGGAIGAMFGAVAARRVKMTAMPQMVALFNGVGGGAAALVSLAEFHRLAPAARAGCTATSALAIVLSALIGSVSFAGSMVAFAKLQELIGAARSPIRASSS